MASDVEVQPYEDYGFFGPESITWRVWKFPTSLTIGFQRAVVIEELDPFLLAAVEATQKVRYQPRIRYDHTLKYFATIAFADARTAIKASEMLVKIHSRAVGIEPVSGNTFDANDPDSQLWIHMTAWHSILYAYERFGPGRLKPEEEEQYWAECAVAAELQTCDPASVPRTREGVREYFELVRPRLAASESTQSMMNHLLHAKIMFPPLPKVFAPLAWLVSRVLRTGTIATMPRWQRKLAGLRQPRVLDWIVTPILWVAFQLATLRRRNQVRVLGMLSPATRPVVEPILLDVEPKNPVTYTPAQARERYGVLPPLELYRQLQQPAAADRVASLQA